jgi:hypothetical protein
VKIHAKIEIEGIKPLLINTFPIDTLDAGKNKSGIAGNDAEGWKKTVLMTEKRELYVFSSYLTGSIINGAKQIKVGKGNLSKKVGASLECMDEKILFDGLIVPEEKDLTRLATDIVYLDVRSVVNPMTKGRNLRYRIATKAGWKIKTIISWDDVTVSKDHMKECVKNAGIYEGIGDGRKIGFGRFKLLSFEMKE